MLHNKDSALISPSVQNERLVVIDILRGFALFGILLVNMNSYHSPYMYAEMLRIDLWDDGIDVAVNNVVQWGAQGKFYTLFSILFGMSFVLLMYRLEEKSVSAPRLIRRRLLFLLVIGVLHLLFLWWGDILTSYALGGFVLLAFLQSKPRTWLIRAAALVVMYAAIIALAAVVPSVQMDAQPAEAAYSIERVYDQITASYSGYSGRYGDVFRQRFDDITSLFSGLLMTTLFLLVPLFLFGMYIGKKKIDWFSNRLSKERLQRLKTWSMILCVVGMMFTILKQWSARSLTSFEISGVDVLNFACMIVGDTALCLFYVVLLLRLYQLKPTWRIWSYLSSAGKMAMSNYLLQSLVCTTLFYGYGFALYGRIGPLQGMIIAIVLYACQLKWSKWWLRRFRQGPLETIWRKFTYYNATRSP